MRTAMLVNDSRLEARILADMLKMIGFEVVLSDEIRALEDMKRIQPDVVLVNYIMKTMRGDALVGMMKLYRSDTLAILTSSNELSMEDFQHRRIDALLRTPTSSTGLREALRRAQKNVLAAPPMTEAR